MITKRLISRRHALKLGLVSLTSVTIIAADRAKYQSSQVGAIYNPKRTFKVVHYAPLKELAAAKGLIYGAAAPQEKLSSDTAFTKCFTQQCSLLMPEGPFTWGSLRPSPDKFDFTYSDWCANFARTNSMLFRGGALVWYQDQPNWLRKSINRQNAEKFLAEHITNVTKHFAGQMHSWDVVNEAIEPEEGRSDGLRNKDTPWLEFLGPDYIELAFRVAAQGDPKALLVYNETGLEYDIPTHEARRSAVLKLLERLKSKGTPIHALGIQSHLAGDETHFNPKKLQKFLNNVASLGLKILITELDVKDQRLPVDPTVRDRIVAAAYEDYLSVVLDEPAVIAVLTWGLSDRSSWLSIYSPRADGALVRPLPLDANLKPKLAWNAIARAFDKAPKR